MQSYHRKANPILNDYHINNNILNRVVEIKDLEVTFVENMTFNKHIDLCIAKGNSMLGFIKRWTVDIKDQATLLILYFAYIRSHLEYAVSVWCPFYASNSNRIEGIQKKFLLYLAWKGDWVYDKNIPYYENIRQLPPYNIRCQELNITTLESRRQLIGSTLVGNTLLGYIDSPFIMENIQIHIPTRNLRQHRFLHLDAHRTNYGENEPMNQITKQFNLVEHLFDFNYTKAQFKNKLKKYHLQNTT